MHISAKRIIQDIKALEIQGARNIAKSALDALEIQAEKSKATTVQQLIAELQEVREGLVNARETEPMLRNFASIIFTAIQESDPENVVQIKQVVRETKKKILALAEASFNRIKIYGSRKITEGMTVLTHCHSSTVIGILEKAWKSGKKFKVYATETRPRHQGHKTVKDLAKIGIPVTLIIDSAVPTVMPKVDLCLVGCDVLTAEGVVINKVGTKNVALSANYYGVPIYVCGETFKMDPLTLEGYLEHIEERDHKELGFRQRGVDIFNPAFDVTSSKLIHGLITEKGVIPPQQIALYFSTQL